MMTRINLLPQEWRKKEMTPLATLIPVLAGITLVVGAGFFWGWLHFAELSGAEAARDEVRSIRETLAPSLQYAGKLEAEEGEYKSRQSTIESIRASRVPWTRKLDEFWDVLTDDDGGKKYLVRIDNLTVRAPQSRKKDEIPGDEVVVKGICFNQDNPLKHFTIAHESICQSKFFRGEFEDINDPAGKAVDEDGDSLIPTRGWTMDLVMRMKSRSSKKPAPSKGPAAQADRR